MKFYTTANFRRKLNKPTKKHPVLPKLLDKTVQKYIQNPNHPGLRLHKLSGNQSQYWSITVAKNIRLLFRHTQQGILFINIGSHDEVY